MDEEAGKRLESPRPRDAFDAFDLRRLFGSPSIHRNLNQRLEAARDYMIAAADCLDVHAFQLIDPKSVLTHFEEVFLASKRLVGIISQDYETRLGEVDSSLSLCQNVVRLGAVAPRTGQYRGWLERLRRVEREMPGIRLQLSEDESVPVTPTTLLEVKTAINRVQSILNASVSLAEEWKADEEVVVADGIYDPREVPKEALATLLAHCLEAVEATEEMPSEARQVVVRELRWAIREINRHFTPWSRVFSRVTQITLVLAAAVTVAGGADEASENLIKAHEWARESIELFQQRAVIIRRYGGAPLGDSRSLPKPTGEPLRSEAPGVENDSE